MLCENCQKTNRESAKFCKWCGQPMLAKANHALDNLVGMSEIKQKIHAIINTYKSLKQRASASGSHIRLSMNTLIIGNTGTGKTTLAKALQELFFANDIVSSPNIKMVDAVDYDNFVKDWDRNIKAAKGGILFIDNVQKLLPDGYSTDINKLDKLFVEMDHWENDPIVMLAGLPGGLESFLTANPAVRNRFQYLFQLSDYLYNELLTICIQKLRDKYFGLTLSEEAHDKLSRQFKYAVKTKDESFGNGHLAAKKAEEIFTSHLNRTSADVDNMTVIPEDIKGYVPEEKTLDEILAELNDFIGMENVKDAVREIAQKVQTFKEREKRGMLTEQPAMHMVLTGNPGTGKTTIARKLGEIFEAIGFLDTGNVIEVDRSKMVSQYMGETPKLVDELCDKAMDGILFVDEAYTLAPQSNSGEKDKLGTEAIERLMKRMEDDRDKFVVIAAGYQTEMNNFLSANEGLKKRFDRFLHIDDYTPEELFEIFKIQAKKKKFSLGEGTEERLQKAITQIYESRDRSFANAREMRRLFEETTSRLSSRLNKIANPTDEMLETILPEDIPYEEAKELDLNECLGGLNELVGLENVKAEVRKLVSYLNMERQRAMSGGEKTPLGIHFAFTGNPGTGKTTVARIMADVFKSLGILSRGHLVEADRSKLVGAFSGETAIKTNQLIDTAMGGVLFIDEAYNLITADNDSFGKEAVDTLLKRLTDDKGKFICIVAGYTKEMHDFIASNPGLPSRFNHQIEFADYQPEALTQIFRNLVAKKMMTLTSEANKHLKNYFEGLYISRDKNFGNAREVVRVFEQALTRQGDRLSKVFDTPGYTPDMLNELTIADITGEEAGKAKTLEEIMSELDEFVGMTNVKEAIKALARQVEFNKMRMDRGLAGAEILALNLMLTGNPGTGKTTIARKLGEIFKAIGLLPSDKVIEVDRSQMVSQYAGETPKEVNKLCDRAMGGILFVDEAYTLAPTDESGSKDKSGTEAIESLMKRMEDDRGKFVVILAGYQTEMEQFIRVNPGIDSRITHRIHIDDYTVDELMEIFKMSVRKKKYMLLPETEEKLKKAIGQKVEMRAKNFGNAREMRKMFDQTTQLLSERISLLPIEEQSDEDFVTIRPEDIPMEESKVLDPETVLGKLNELIGLNSVKDEVRNLVAYLNMERERAQAGGVKKGVSPHFVFSGNPGTGKTTVARIMAEVFKSLGILSRGHLVEADRSLLVAGFSGQTAIKTNQLVDRALGGVLFIDEAYTLNGGSHDEFGHEAINTLLKRLEDDKGKFICIVAGYTNEMQDFLDSNPGLPSRFTKTIHFPDYSAEEMTLIFRSMVEKNKMQLDVDADTAIPSVFEKIEQRKDKNFANAREVRKLFESAMTRQSSRLSAIFGTPDFNPDDLNILIRADIIENE